MNPRFQPQLAVIQAGNRPDSSTYIRMKAKAADIAGIKVNHITIPEDTSVQDTVEIVQRLNNDDQVTGILVQLPLGSHVGPEGEQTVTQSVSLEKDVDGCFLSNLFLFIEFLTFLYVKDFMLVISDTLSPADRSLFSPHAHLLR